MRMWQLIINRVDGTMFHISGHATQVEALSRADRLAFSGKAGPWTIDEDGNLSTQDQSNENRFYIIPSSR